MVFCALRSFALRSFARLAQLFCVLSDLFGPLKCICVCGWGGRSSTRLSDPTVLLRRSNHRMARERLPPLAARSGVRAGESNLLNTI